MGFELAIRAIGVAAIVAPVFALAGTGSAPSTWIGAGLLAVALASLTALCPLRRRPSQLVELDEAIDELEAELERVGATWSETVRRAETAGRFREEFVSAVRHELKTPLNAILGFADILLQEVDGPITERQREDLDAIRSAGEYLQELVEAVLAEWRPRKGTPLPIGRVELSPLLDGVANILRGQLRGRPIAIRVEVPEGLRGPLADARRVRQVLINLGTNALRATERGAVTFGASDEGEDVRLTVTDTGSGIDPDALPTLFSRFTQAGDEPSREGGSGLGLALAREMVEWHGGRIEVETKVGEGTRVSVLLPRGVR